MKRKRALVMFSSLCLVLALIASSVSMGCPKPPPEEKVVKIGNFYDLSGPTADIGISFKKGIDLGIEVINDKGGVNGVKIESVWEDNGLSPDKMISSYGRFKEKGVVVLTSIMSPTTQIIKPLCERDNIPFLSGAGARQTYSPGGGIWCTNYDYDSGINVCLDWVVENDWDWSKEAPKIGLCGWDNESGHAPVEGTRAYAKELGMVWVGEEFFPTTATDCIIELNRLKEAGANYIIATSPGMGMVVYYKAADSLGFKEGGIRTIGFKGGCTDDKQVCKTLGEISDGSIGGLYWPTQTEMATTAAADPITSEFVQAWKKYHGSDITTYPEYSTAIAMGYQGVLIIEEGLRLALKEVPAEELTGESFREYGLDCLTRLDLGEFGDVIGYDSIKRIPVDRMRVGMWDAGKVTTIPITGWVPVPPHFESD